MAIMRYAIAKKILFSLLISTASIPAFSFDTSDESDFLPEGMLTHRSVDDEDDFSVSLRKMWKTTIPPRHRSLQTIFSTKMLTNTPSALTTNLFYANDSRRKEVFKEILSTELLTMFAPEAVKLLDDMTFMSHTLGTMISGVWHPGWFSLGASLPLSVTAHHLWLPKDAQEELGDFFSQGEGMLTESQTAQLKKSIEKVRVRAGVGDLILSAAFAPHKDLKTIKSRIGLRASVPIDSLLRENKSYAGLTDATTNVSLDDIVEDLNSASETGDEFNYAKNFINLIHAVGTEPTIGTKNFLFGPFMESTVSVKNTSFSLFGFFGHPLTNTEYRVIKLKDPSDITKIAIEPREFKVEVFPGNIFNVTTVLSQKITNKCTFGGGYDFFMQNKEDFEQVFTTHDIYSNLVEDDAKRSRATQHRLFAFLEISSQIVKHPGSFTLWGDYTIGRENIGRGTTVSMSCRLEF
ncbi:hypothetical protein HOD08_03320 [bacterium]|nr:hypothetical protein [bacterium]